MNKNLLTLLLLAVAIANSSADTRTKSPVYFERTLPYPTYAPSRFEWPVSMLFSGEYIYRLQLRVSADGRVDSLVLPQALAGYAPGPVSQFVDSLRFEPGSIDGKPAAFWIYAKLEMYGKAWLPALILPTDSTGQVAQPDIYFESFELNGVSLPALVDFPRFACYFNPQDSLSAIPTSVVAVDLDADGALVDRKMIQSNALLPDGQLLSALLWAKFRPLQIAGQGKPSRVYITASCFPLQDKPVYPFAPVRDSLRDFFREYQVHTRYDTLGLLLPAIPLRARPSEMIVNASGHGSRGAFTMRLKIDTTGKAHSPLMGAEGEYRRNLVKTLLRDLRFHPAINWHGEPVAFSGLVRIDPGNEPTVRIEYFW